MGSTRNIHQDKNAEGSWVFLSHSGEQKDFTERLYHELLHLSYRPFFDQDADASLRKGHPFPPAIQNACLHASMGIIVLSDKYIESMWPMLELQLLFTSPSKPLIYPLFYKLQPADLTSREKLAHWWSSWQKKIEHWQIKTQDAFPTSSSDSGCLTLDIEKWPNYLATLKHRTGEIKAPSMSEHAYIESIICNICKNLPPPWIYSLGPHVQGGSRMQQVIDEYFRKDCGLTVIGVYGVGGSGKSTLGQIMANFYRKDFAGRSVWLEFPTKEDKKELLEVLKQVLSVMSRSVKHKVEGLLTVEQALGVLENILESSKVFLAIDNVWDWAFLYAKQILSMEYNHGSKVMVTSRSKPVLECLLPKDSILVVMPTITVAEAVGALKSYHSASNVVPSKDLESLAGSCFFDGKCNPLLLKAMGATLREVSGCMNPNNEWKDIIGRLQGCLVRQDGKMEDTLLSVFRTSYDAISTELQKVFLDLVTCVPPPLLAKGTFFEVCEWLKTVNQGYKVEEWRLQLQRLEYHGLLDINEGALFSGDIRIHDLHKSLAESVVGSDVHRRFLFEKDPYSLSSDHWKNLKCVRRSSHFPKTSYYKRLEHCSNLEVLMFEKGIPLSEFSVQRLVSLRILHMHSCNDLVEIQGWEGASDLVSIELIENYHLKKVGNLGCLHNLEKLVMEYCDCNVPELTHCYELRTLHFSRNRQLKDVKSLGQPPKLQSLNLPNNINLVDMRTIGMLTALKHLDLQGCMKLRKFPDINLEHLLTLNLSKCTNLQTLEGRVCTLTGLEELDLRFCRNLRRVPDFKNLCKLRVLLTQGCIKLREIRLGTVCTLGFSKVQCLCLLGWKSANRFGIFGPPSDCLVVELDKMSFMVMSLQDPGSQELVFELQGQLRAILPQLYLGTFQWDIRFMGQIDTSAFKNLQELKIKDTNQSSVDMSGMPSLKKLSLSCFYSMQEVAGLNALANLQHLQFKYCCSLKQISNLCCLTDLRVLQIKYCFSLASLSELSYLTSLESLGLIGCGATLQAIPSNSVDVLVKLKNLTLGGDTAVQAFPTSSPLSLAVLTLQDCVSLFALPRLPASLNTLYLTRCTSLADLSSLECVSRLNCLQLEDCSLWGNVRALKCHPLFITWPNLLEYRWAIKLGRVPEHRYRGHLRADMLTRFLASFCDCFGFSLSRSRRSVLNHPTLVTLTLSQPPQL